MINKKLIHFNTYSAFEANKSLLYDWTIAFIGETKQIYTHGNFYDCDIEDINELENKIAELQLDIYGYESGVYIAVQSGKLIDPNEYDSTTETAVGVAVIDPKARFIIGLNYSSEDICWGNDSQNLLTNIVELPDYLISDTATTDMNGFANTSIINNIYSGLDCASGYAASQSIVYGNSTLTGYLGSAGEWLIILDNYTEINTALLVLGCTIFQEDLYYYTSTEKNSLNAWSVYITTSDINRNINSTTKTNARKVLPFYSLNNTLLELIEKKFNKLQKNINTIEDILQYNALEKDPYPNGVYIATSNGGFYHYTEWDSSKGTGKVAVKYEKLIFAISSTASSSGFNKYSSFGNTSDYSDIPNVSYSVVNNDNYLEYSNIITGFPAASSAKTAGGTWTYRNNKIDAHLPTIAETWAIINYSSDIKLALLKMGHVILGSVGSTYDYWYAAELSSTMARTFRITAQQYTQDGQTKTINIINSGPGQLKTTSIQYLSQTLPFYRIPYESIVPDIDTRINNLKNTYAGGTAVTLNGTSKSGSTASFYAPTSAGTSGYILKSNGSGAPSWIAKTKTFTNVSASSWVSDTTYEDYPYKCNVSCSGITSSYYAEVVFDTAEALSGNYAPVCSTGSSIVTIYSKVNDTITIPTIFATLS